MDTGKVLSEADVIAVVGCSHQPFRTSHRISKYLQEVGYRVIPVNPYHEEILGERCYASLDAIPDDISVDIVSVFRKPQFTAKVVEETRALANRSASKPLIWTQVGVSSLEAQSLADEAGLPYVANRCIMVDHAMMRQHR